MDPEFFELISSSSEFIIQKSLSGDSLHIDRSIMSVTRRKREPSIKQSERIFGIFGTIQLYLSHYLITIKSAIHVARLNNSFIYLIKDIDFHPYTSLNIDSPEYQNDKRSISFLKSLILTDTFYFSYDFDLTLSLQKLASQPPSSKALKISERCDEKYFWNQQLCDSMIKADLHEFVMPIINGFVKGESFEINGTRFDYILISRRDKRRTGTRFNTRGLDDKGNAVNFVETEQIIAYLRDDYLKIHSHIQIRGSIPLIWQQKPNLSWTPRPKIINSAQQNSSSAEFHFNELHSTYGGVSILNLIDKKGSQKTIGTAFSNLLTLLSNKQLFYHWFDFHHECKNMKYENLKFLLRDIKANIEDFGWCELRMRPEDYFDKAEVVRRQTGVFRTNCMDCLDRTNVVQNVVARAVLLRQLRADGFGEEPNGEAYQPLAQNLEVKFRDLWVKNADAMSVLYSGTPAQKTDFTRIGKRTLKGYYNDGVYSLQRFVINNFLDGSKQNALDLLLGKLSVKAGVSLGARFYSLCVFLTILLTSVLIVYSAAKKSDGIGFYLMFGIGMALVGTLLKAYGSLFVDKPIISSN